MGREQDQAVNELTTGGVPEDVVRLRTQAESRPNPVEDALYGSECPQ